MYELPNQSHLSPSKRKVIAKCSLCDNERELRRDYYNNIVKQNKNYCSSCAIKIAHSEGKCKLSSDLKSEISKKAWSDPDLLKRHRDNSISRNTTEEYKLAQSIRTLKLWTDDEYRQNVSNGIKSIMTDDMKTKISESIKSKWAEEKQQQKYSDSLKKRWMSKSYRDIMREIHGSESYRNKISEIAKKAWSSEEYRRKMKLIHDSDDYKAKMSKILANNPKISSLQIKLYEYLDGLNVEYFEEGCNTRIGYYVFDCLIPKQNNIKRSILIECQGDYWHSLPKNIRNDKSKFSYINRYFPEYEIVYLWEREFFTKDRIISKLKSKLNIEQLVVNFEFSNVVVKECSYKEASEFLDAYHYIGKGRGGICIGAYLNDILIGCIVYSKKLRQNQNFGQDFRELSRFCIHPNYHKKNFGSWFISKSYKFLDVKFIVAFTDTTVGHCGTIYKSSNFKLSHEVDSDYWYVDADGFVMHKRTLYSQAIRMKMTEREYAEHYGYNKKYGGKKICYVKQI